MAPRTATDTASRVVGPGGLAALRDRLRRGSRDPGIERIYRDHHQAIYRYCLAIVRNPADAEDALQATMAAAVRSLPTDRGKAAIRPWLFRVAHNESISIIRARREHPREEPALEQTTGSAADELADRERLRTLVADLQSLPERQRSALVMRELSGLSYAEVGGALDCAEGAARQLVHEARTALLTRNEGRAMDCEEAREAIDSGDRRRLRGRKLKAHLSACGPCGDYRAAIEVRERDLGAICPPLPVAAAGGVLAAVLSGGGTGGGAAATGGAAAVGAGATTGLGAGSVAGGLGASAAVKGASLVAAGVLAAGAADVSGVVDLPGPIGGEKSGSQSAPVGDGAGSAPGTAPETTGAAGKPGSEQAKRARAQGEKASSKKGANGRGKGRGKGNGKGKSAGKGNGKGGGHSQGKGPGSAPGQAGNGNAGGNPGNAGGNPAPGPPATSPAPPQAGGGGAAPAPAPGGPPPGSNGGGNAPAAPGNGGGGPPAGKPGGGPPG